VSTTHKSEWTSPRFPMIVVDLTGGSGNALMIIGKVRRAMRFARDEHGERIVTNEQCAEFSTEASSGDYDHVLQTCMAWVEVY